MIRVLWVRTARKTSRPTLRRYGPRKRHGAGCGRMTHPCAGKNSGIQNVPSDDEIRRMLKDPSLSTWLVNAMTSAMERDPVDAANDAGLLSMILDKRATTLLEKQAALMRLAGEP